jgi:hypothetical protein
MNAQRSLFSLFAFVLLGLIAASSSIGAVDAARDYEVIRAEFGIIDFDNAGKSVFIPTAVVPFKPEQSYGWIMLLRTAKAKISFREEFTLPVKPDTWGDPEPLGTRTLSADRRTAITERTVTPDRGLIFKSWQVAPGDPKGHHVIRVYIEGRLEKVFEFDLR